MQTGLTISLCINLLLILGAITQGVQIELVDRRLSRAEIVEALQQRDLVLAGTAKKIAELEAAIQALKVVKKK